MCISFRGARKQGNLNTHVPKQLICFSLLPLRCFLTHSSLERGEVGYVSESPRALRHDT